MNRRALFRPVSTPSSSGAGIRLPGLMFWAVNALIIGAIYLLIVQPLQNTIAAGRESLAERRATLARYEAVIAQTDAIKDYAKRVAAGNARGEFIPGENEGIVAANLQARLKAAADDAKVSVRSLQMLPSKTVKGAALLGARLEVTGTLAAVHALARNIESAAPLLFISDADLRNQTLIWGVASDKEPEIEAQFDVLGAAAPRAAQ